MPFLRFTRDKRGYEHTYLLHASAKKGGTARLLYWYRTPPGVKVGRAAFDEAIRQALAAQYPGIGFDWPTLMSTPLPPPDVEHWRERRRVEKAARQARQSAERGLRGPSEAEETDESESAQDEAAWQAQGAAEASVPPRPGTDETGEPSVTAFAAGEPGAAASVESPEAGVATAAPTSGTNQPVPTDAAGRARRRRRRGGRRRRRELPSGAAGLVAPSSPSDGAERSFGHGIASSSSSQQESSFPDAGGDEGDEGGQDSVAGSDSPD